MMIKTLGILDLLSALLFFINNAFANFSRFLPSKFLWFAALYLITKGLIFLLSADIASIIDIACGGVIILSIFFALPKLIVVLITLFLVQKGVFSLLS